MLYAVIDLYSLIKKEQIQHLGILCAYEDYGRNMVLTNTCEIIQEVSQLHASRVCVG